MEDEPEPEEDGRQIELSAISYTFSEFLIDASDPYSASLDIQVTPNKPISVAFRPLAGGAPLLSPGLSHSEIPVQDLVGKLAVAGIEPRIRSLSHLPPLKLHVSLPTGYPESVPPKVTLECEPLWLSQSVLKRLEEQVHDLWEEVGRSEVVYRYIDFLQQEAEDGFRLVTKDGDALELDQDLEMALLAFDLEAKQAKFEQETFKCGICLEPKKGAVCHRLLSCGHVFCVACLQDFYNSCITEGDVTNVRCLDPDCAKELAARNPKHKRRRKADRTLNPGELLEIPMEQSQVQRYAKLKRKKKLESDKSTVYCPRKWCQGAARSEREPERETLNADASDAESEAEEAADTKARSDSEDEIKLPPPSERVAICSDCSFAFCSVCRQGWHGEIVSCLPPRKRGELTAEEQASEDYLVQHSTRCPTCDARCQKSMGCNHMICFQCRTHFCYLCSAWLCEDDPYIHFNTSDTPCYQRLWEMEEGDNGGPVPNGPPRDGGNLQAAPAGPAVHEVRLEPAEEAVQPAAAPPPPAPVPPAPPAGARVQGPPWQQNGVRVNRRVQQGLARGPPVRHPLGNLPQGLQRFLDMAQNDQEDEWDSDELDDDDDWEIPIRAR